MEKIKCGENEADASHGSKTMTVTGSEQSGNGKTVKIKARDNKETPKRRVTWTEETVDNEHMGKKSSKVCCIYHKPHTFGESSSSSDSSDDDISPLERKPKAMKKKLKKCAHAQPGPSSSSADS